MPDDAHLVLQAKLLAAFKADAQLAAAPLGGRIFDQVPSPEPAFPYASLGDGQEIAERAECFEGAAELFMQVDVWSRSTGWPEAKKIAGRMRAVIEGAALDLGPDHRLVVLTFEDVQFLRDPDGLTRHAALTVRAMTEPA